MTGPVGCLIVGRTVRTVVVKVRSEKARVQRVTGRMVRGVLVRTPALGLPRVGTTPEGTLGLRAVVTRVNLPTLLYRSSVFLAEFQLKRRIRRILYTQRVVSASYRRLARLLLQ